MNRKRAKRIKKAIRRWCDTPWTNGTYLKLCGISAVIGAAGSAILGCVALVNDRNNYRTYAEEGYKKDRIPVTEEVWYKEYVSESKKEDEEA